MNALLPSPIEIDPRPCEHCGRTIDHHDCVDDGEGPEFFCWGDPDLLKQWELADPRDRWRRTGEAPPSDQYRNGPFMSVESAKPRPYRTPDATVSAFWYVAAHESAEHLARWLEQHPRDVSYLRKLQADKCRAR